MAFEQLTAVCAGGGSNWGFLDVLGSKAELLVMEPILFIREASENKVWRSPPP
jgi:hypothetical protein